MAYETWYYIKDGKLWEHWENDGPTFMRRGKEAVDTVLCNIEEADEKYPKELKKALDTYNF